MEKLGAFGSLYRIQAKLDILSKVPVKLPPPIHTGLVEGLVQVRIFA